MQDLPIDELLSPLAAAIEGANRFVVKAPTGSGKSTRMPQMVSRLLSGEVKGRILVLQPRRLAARMLAARVASEMKCQLGGTVGYQIRFENHSSAETRILYVTEGILLRRMLADPNLSDIKAIFFDEFHERHLYTDISLARSLELQRGRRPDLKLFVMSATLDGIPLERVFDDPVFLESAGRTFPVEMEYLKQSPGDEPPWELAARILEQKWSSTPGHALVFMPGAYEIQRSLIAIRSRLPSGTPVMALHGEMPSAEQDAAVDPEGPRRVIVSTNVAETSLTIDGVTLVVDSGLARIARFDSRRGIDTLLIEKISRASADQRAGRAGRTMPGRCVRLWTERDHERRSGQETPEIHRMDLAEVVLTLKASGVERMEEFRWIDPPTAEALASAETLLADLGAIREEGGPITGKGRRMLEFPVHPRYAGMLLEADRLGCVRAAALLAALTQSRNILTRADRATQSRREDLFGGGSSDFHQLARAFQYARNHKFEAGRCRSVGVHGEAARQVDRLFEQFLDIAERQKLGSNEGPAADESISKCMLAAFADRVGRRRSAGNSLCDLVHGRRARLATHSTARNSRLIVAGEIHEIGHSSGDSEIQLSLVAEIEEAWLRELFPDHIKEESLRVYDSGSHRVVIRRERRFRDLVLESSEQPAPADEETAVCLAGGLRDSEIIPPLWNEKVPQWMARIAFVASHENPPGLPAMDQAAEEFLFQQYCQGAVSFRDLKDKSPLPVLRQWLSDSQWNFVDSFAPESLSLPGGRSGKIRYTADSAILSAPIQQLFGWKEAPRIAHGTFAVTIEVLAPNQRPVQTTRDLASFWQQTYPELKQAMQRRYPKHAWPDNPLLPLEKRS